MLILITVCSVVYFILLVWAFLGIRRYRGEEKRRIRHGSKNTECPSVSVIIAARNEVKNLENLCQCLSRQSYAQVIIVDNLSTNSARNATRLLCERYKFEYLTIESVPKRYSPKKFAIEVGIRNARHDIILLTDADCRPQPEWVDSLAALFTEDSIAVIGFSPVVSESKFLSAILTLDSLAAVVPSLAGVGWRKPFLTTGRNWAYRKSVFEKVDGFSGIREEISGDDDLLLQKLSSLNEGKIAFALNPKSHVESIGPASFLDWLAQKRRHLSAAKKYPLKIQCGYFLFHISNLILWLAPFVIGRWGIVFLLLKLCGDFWILAYTSKNLCFKMPKRAFILWEVLFVFIHWIAGPTVFVGKVRWKRLIFDNENINPEKSGSATNRGSFGTQN